MALTNFVSTHYRSLLFSGFCFLSIGSIYANRLSSTEPSLIPITDKTSSQNVLTLPSPHEELFGKPPFIADKDIAPLPDNATAVPENHESESTLDILRKKVIITNSTQMVLHGVT